MQVGAGVGTVLGIVLLRRSRKARHANDQSPETANKATARAESTHGRAQSSRPSPSSGQGSNQYPTTSDQTPQTANEATTGNGSTESYSEVLYATGDWSQSQLRVILAQLQERAVEARMEEGDLVVNIRAESVCDRIVTDVTGVPPSDD